MDQPAAKKRSLRELANRPKISGFNLDGTMNSAHLERYRRIKESVLKPEDYVIKDPLPDQNQDRIKLETGTSYADKIKAKAEKHAIEVILGNEKPKTYKPLEPSELLYLPDDDETDADEPPPVSHANATNPVPLIDSRIKPDRTLQALPIASMKSRIVDSIRSNRVTIIEGSTGCGKTTQVPLYIHEDMLSRGETRHNIVVTQPRRIAAVSVAKHVARLLNTKLGDEVGFQIGFSRQHSGPKTKILYCTIGVLLQKIVFARGLSYFTHIVIDEVHERDIDTDLLLMVVRKLIWEQNSPVKLVLMSASFRTEHFANYFRITMPDPRWTHLTTPVILPIEGKPQELTTFFLDNLISSQKWTIQAEVPSESQFQILEPGIHPDLFKVCCGLIGWFDQMPDSDSKSVILTTGAILIFLPGLYEIDQLHDAIKAFDTEKRYHVLRAHSSLDDSCQHKIFDKAPEGQRKVILSTNIAESSITVPDVSHVIDFCLTKALVMDDVTGLPTLQLQWVSKANAIQRAGRAGRVSRGRAWRLVHSKFYALFKPHPTPEICRCPLEQAVLRVKALSLGPPKELLASCLDPPPLEHIRYAVLKLKRLGALTVSLEEGNHPDLDGELTALGKIMNVLPIDVSLSKLIAMGYAVGLLEDCVNMAAALTVDDLFDITADRLDVYKTRFELSNRTFCDLLTARNIISKFIAFTQTLADSHQTIAIEGEQKKWARYYNLSIRRLREVTDLRDEILLRLERVGMKDDYDPDECAYLSPSDREILLKCIFAAAFYPSYFTRGEIDQKFIERDELDPYTMVNLGNLPKNSLIYAPQITEFFSPVCTGRHLSITFMDSRAYVAFPAFDSITLYESTSSNIEDTISRRRENDFPRSVYLALMLKSTCSDRLTIRACGHEDTLRTKVAQVRQALKKEDLNRATVVFTPTLTIEPHVTVNLSAPSVAAMVSHVEKCGHFWVRLSPQDTNKLNVLRDTLASLQLTRVSVYSIYSSMPCIFEEDVHGIIRRSRAVVLAFTNITDAEKADETANRIFIRLVDSGQTVWTHISSLFQVPEPVEDSKDQVLHPLDSPCSDVRELLLSPALALECRLVNMTSLHPSSGRFSEANQYFETLMDTLKSQQPDIELQIYSHISGLAHVSITPPASSDFYGKCLSEHLVKLGYAEFSQETISSNIDHTRRERFRTSRAATTITLEGVTIALSTSKSEASFLQDLKPICVNPSLLWGKLTCEFNPGDCRIFPVTGPSNPLEVTFFGVCSSYKWTAAKLDKRSINAVVLEPDVTQAKTRMMVAPVCVMRHGKISAVKTSLMPYVRGFAPLMQMLFAPKVALRYDSETNCYLGALSGLGTEPISRSDASIAPLMLDEEFDMQIDFDAYFTSIDILKIQTVRYLFSLLLQDTSVTAKHAIAGQVASGRECRERLRSCILSLVNKNRFPRPKQKSVYKNVQAAWQSLSTDQRKPDIMQFGQLARPSLAPIPEPAAVNPTLSSIKDTFHRLKRSASEATPHVTVRCPICGLVVAHRSFLQHEQSREHRIQQLLFDCHYDQEIKDEQVEEQWKLRKATASLPSEDSDDEMLIDE